MTMTFWFVKILKKEWEEKGNEQLMCSDDHQGTKRFSQILNKSIATSFNVRSRPPKIAILQKVNYTVHPWQYVD